MAVVSKPDDYSEWQQLGAEALNCSGYPRLHVTQTGFGQVTVVQAGCPAGEEIATPSSEETCIKCSPGTFKASKVNNLWTARCRDCPAGKFMDTVGASHCEQCDAGKYTAQIGSTVCDNCEAGKFKAAAGVNLACDTCEVGKHQASNGRNCAEAVPSESPFTIRITVSNMQRSP